MRSEGVERNDVLALAQARQSGARAERQHRREPNDPMEGTDPMATRSPDDHSDFDRDAWEAIVDLAARIAGQASTGRDVDEQLALRLARSILVIEADPPTSHTKLRTR